MIVGLFAFFGIIIFLVLILYGLVAYIFFSIGLYAMAKNDGVEYPILAFIPIANNYLIGNLIKQNFTIFSFKIENPEFILPVGLFLCYSLYGIPGINTIAFILGFILNVAAMYHLFKKYKGNSATLYTVLCIIFAIIYPFVIFIMRNDTPVDDSYGSHRNEANI